MIFEVTEPIFWLKKEPLHMPSKYSSAHQTLEPCNVAMLCPTIRTTSKHSNAYLTSEPGGVGIRCLVLHPRKGMKRRFIRGRYIVRWPHKLPTCTGRIRVFQRDAMWFWKQYSGVEHLAFVHTCTLKICILLFTWSKNTNEKRLCLDMSWSRRF